MSRLQRIAGWAAVLALLVRAVWLPFHLASEPHSLVSSQAGDGAVEWTVQVVGGGLTAAVPHATDVSWAGDRELPHSIHDHDQPPARLGDGQGPKVDPLDSVDPRDLPTLDLPPAALPWLRFAVPLTAERVVDPERRTARHRAWRGPAPPRAPPLA